MLTLDSRVRQHPDTVACDVDGELLMMNTHLGRYFGLNGSGNLLWSQLRAAPRIGEPSSLMDSSSHPPSPIPISTLR
jgi:hypothetical protein